MKNLITTIKFLAKVCLFVFAFVAFSQNAHAAVKINYGQGANPSGPGTMSLCKNIADAAPEKTGSSTVTDSNTTYDASAGELVSIVGYASNIGATDATVDFSTSYPISLGTVNVGGVNKSKYKFTVTVSGISSDVYVTVPLGQTLSLENVKKAVRSSNSVYPFSGNLSNSVYQGSIAVRGWKNLGGYYTGCNGYGIPVIPLGLTPQNADFETSVIWGFRVSQSPQGNPPVVSNINPAGTVQNPANLTWNATNNPTQCFVDYWNGGNAWDTYDNTAPYSIAIPSSAPGTYQGSITCTNQYGSDTQQFSYTIQQAQQNPPFVTANANTSNVSWSATNNPSSCTVTYTTTPYTSNTYSYPSTASVPSITTLPAGYTSFTYAGYVTCTNGQTSNQAPFSYTVQQQQQPIYIDIKANNQNSLSVVQGTQVTLSWSPTASSGTIPANGCTLSWAGGSWNGTGQTPVFFASATQTYSITCSAPGVPSTTDSVTVTVTPQVTPTLTTSLAANGVNAPGTLVLTQGQTLSLSYSVLAQNGGTGSSLNCQRPVSTGGGWNSPLTTNTGGIVTQSLGAQNTVGTKIYYLNCTYAGITSNKQVTVTVNQAAATPIGIDLRANGSNGPLSLAYGAALTLNWNPTASSGTIPANGCTLSWAAGTYTGTGSTPSFGATTSTTYTINCVGTSGQTASDSVTVNVGSAPTPSVSLLSVSPLSTNPGQPVSIVYSSQNTTACQLYVQVPGAIAFVPTGSATLPTTGTTSYVIPSSPTTGTYTFKVVCNGVSSGTQSVNIQPSNGNPTITTGLSVTGSNGQTAISPNTLTINQGQSATLTYYVNGTGGNAGSNPICQATIASGGYWTYGINSNTSASSVPLGVQNTIGSKTYKLDCTYAGITAPSKQVTVNVVSGVTASVVATANPTSVVLGNTSTINWTGVAVNPNTCFIQKKNFMGLWSTIMSNVSSGQQVTPSNGTNTYRVGCYATSNGGIVYSNNVTVNTTTSSNLNVTLTANGQNPSYSANSGQQVLLAWNVTGSSYPTCTRSWISGTVNSTSGSSYVYPTQTTTYTITCQSTSTSNGGYPVSDTVTVYVNGNGNQLEVTTGTYNNLTDTSVRLYGDLNNDGTGNVLTWFEVSTNSNLICNYSSSGNEYLVNSNMNGSQSFNRTVSNLSDNQTYYYRACGMDSANNVDSGIIYSFTTDQSPNSTSFSISTLSPDDVDDDSAVLRGSVNNEDNVDVWFTYSSDDSTPECTGNDTETYLSGTYDDGQDFDKSIYNLQSNRTYYYRACGEKNGVLEYGNVRTFETNNNNNPVNPPNNGYGLPIVTTLFPGSIGTDSANLQATVNGNGCDTTTWFKYSTGPGSIQPQQTAPRAQGNVSGVVTDSISSLLPGITYYVTAYAQNCRGTVSGGTVAFKTVGPVPTDYDTTTYTYTPTAVVQYIGGGAGADWLRLDIDDNSTITTVGQTSTYKVTWENLTNSVLKNGKISVVFPKQVQVLSTSQGQITSDGSVIVPLGDIQGNKTKDGIYKGEFMITTRARSIAAGTAVVAQAIAAFDTPKSDAQVNAIDYDENQVLNGGLFGAAAFGTGPFGLGPMGWILLLLAILLIFLIARYAAMSRTGYAPQVMHYPPQQLYYQHPPQPIYTQPVYTQPVMQQPVYQAPAAPMEASRPAVDPVSSLPTDNAVDEYEYKPYRPSRPQE